MNPDELYNGLPEEYWHRNSDEPSRDFAGGSPESCAGLAPRDSHSPRSESATVARESGDTPDDQHDDGGDRQGSDITELRASRSRENDADWDSSKRPREGEDTKRLGNAATTFYQDYSAPRDWGSTYNPYERLATGETRCEKFGRLFKEHTRFETAGPNRQQSIERRRHVMDLIAEVPIELSPAEVDLVRKLSAHKAIRFRSFGGVDGYALSLLEHVIQHCRGVSAFEGATWLRDLVKEKLGPLLDDPEAFLYDEDYGKAGGAVVDSVSQFKLAVGKWTELHEEPDGVSFTGPAVWPPGEPRQA